MSQKKSKIGPRFYLLCALSLALAGGIYALIVLDDDASGTTVVPSAPIVTGTGNPPAWHYDQANDRHWDPGHDHWHPGPPPVAGQTPASNPQVPAPPGIENPAPWQYDPATNRHYDPGHGHWHDGPPPTEGR